MDQVMSEFSAPISERCQHCLWSGTADIDNAFVVVDCGRHASLSAVPPDLTASPTGRMRWAAIEWADILTATAANALEWGSDEPPDHGHVADVGTLTTKDVRAIAAILDESAERIRAYESDLKICRDAIGEMKIELTRLRSRVTR